MKTVIIFLIVIVLGLLWHPQPKIGAGQIINSLQAEQNDWIKTHSEYKEIKPFVAADGKTYRVDSIVKWNGEGKKPDISYQIVIVPPKQTETPSSTL